MSITTVPMIGLEDTARARRTDALTSHAAADGTATEREHSWLQIEHALAAKSPMTAMWIWHYTVFEMGQWVSTSRITTGVTELARQGVIVRAGVMKNPSGYKAQAWTLVGEA